MKNMNDSLHERNKSSNKHNRTFSNGTNNSILNDSFKNDSALMNKSTNRELPPVRKRHLSFHPQITLAEFNMVTKMNNSFQNTKSPKLDEPQRVILPNSFNTPIRVEIPKSLGSKSPRKIGEENFNNGFNSLGGSAIDNINLIKYLAPTDIKITATKRLRDYEILATACRRAGKNREEGRAYYSIGVLYDNLGKYAKAVEWYKQFLSVCKSIGDTHGEGLAYNCLGVDCQFLAELTNSPKMYELALKYHQKHRDIGDVSGKFTASINMGIIFSKLGDLQNASLYFQHSLRYALQLQNAYNQSLAIGQLGKIGSLNMGDNITKMQSFVEKYLQLSKELNDKAGLSNAYLKLGQILTDQKNYEEGILNYKRALELLTQMDSPKKDLAKFGYGVAQGLLGMDNHLDSIKKKLTSSIENDNADQVDFI